MYFLSVRDRHLDRTQSVRSAFDVYTSGWKDRGPPRPGDMATGSCLRGARVRRGVSSYPGQKGPGAAEPWVAAVLRVSSFVAGKRELREERARRRPLLRKHVKGPTYRARLYRAKKANDPTKQNIRDGEPAAAQLDLGWKPGGAGRQPAAGGTFEQFFCLIATSASLQPETPAGSTSGGCCPQAWGGAAGASA